MRRAAKKQATDLTKYKVGPDPLEIEHDTTDIVPSTDDEQKRMFEIADELTATGNLSKEEQKALKVWKIAVLSEGFPGAVRKEYLQDFWAWLLGRGREIDHKNTPWHRQALTDDKEVCAYLEQFVSKRHSFMTKLAVMKMRRPVGINEVYLYYKYIVRGASLDKINFLKDFDLFDKDFDDGLKKGNAHRWPGHGPNETAPYEKAREEANRRDGAPAKDILSNYTKTQVEEKSPEPAFPGAAEEVYSAPQPDSADAVAIGNQVAFALEPLLRQLAVQNAPEINAQFHSRLEAENNVKIEKMTEKINELEAKAKRDKEDAERIGIKKEVPDDAQKKLAEDRELLSREIATSARILQESMDRFEAQSKEQIQKFDSSTAALANALKTVPATPALAPATVDPSVYAAIEATAGVVKGIGARLTQIEEAIAAGAGNSSTIRTELVQTQKMLNDVMQAQTAAVEKLPFLLEGFREARETMKELARVEATRHFMGGNGDANELSNAILSRAEADSTQNKEAVLHIAQKISDELRNLSPQIDASTFAATLKEMQSKLARASIGLSYEDASKMIRDLTTSYRVLYEANQQTRRTQTLVQKVKQENPEAQELRDLAAASIQASQEEAARLAENAIRRAETSAREAEAQKRVFEAEAAQKAVANAQLIQKTNAANAQLRLVSETASRQQEELRRQQEMSAVIARELEASQRILKDRERDARAELLFAQRQAEEAFDRQKVEFQQRAERMATEFQALQKTTILYRQEKERLEHEKRLLLEASAKPADASAASEQPATETLLLQDKERAEKIAETEKKIAETELSYKRSLEVAEKRYVKLRGVLQKMDPKMHVPAWDSKWTFEESQELLSKMHRMVQFKIRNAPKEERPPEIAIGQKRERKTQKGDTAEPAKKKQ